MTNTAEKLEIVERPKVQCIPFESWHLTQIDEDENNFEFFGDPMTKLAMQLANTKGPAMTIYSDKVISCFGMIISWPHVASVWVIPTKHLPKYAKSVHGIIKRSLQAGTDIYDLHRIDTTVKETHEAGHRWIKRLGFERESLKKDYGPNKENYVEYARWPNTH